MLRKLCKYELKATTRIFIPLYIVFLVYSILHVVISGFSEGNWTVPEILSLVIYIMMFAGVFVMTLVVIIQRFYKNLLSDEGYLMFTLPSEPWKHIICKLIISMMWSAISFIAAVVSVFIVEYKEIFTNEFLQTIKTAIDAFFGFFGVASIIVIIEILLAVIITLASNILIIYASIATGHLFSQHKILASLGSFIALNSVSQILFTIVSAIVSIPFINEFTNGTFTMNLFHITVWYMNIFTLLLSVGYYILTNYILSRRLNLE